MTDMTPLQDFLKKSDEFIAEMRQHLFSTHATVMKAAEEMGGDAMLRVMIHAVKEAEDLIYRFGEAWYRYTDVLEVIGVDRGVDEDGKDDEGRRETEQ